MNLDWTQIILGGLSLFGLCFQAYWGVKNKKNGDERSKKSEQNLDESTTAITKKIAENTAKVDANTERIEANTKMVEENKRTLQEILERLAVNDAATVSVVRQNIRKMYYDLRPHKMISDTDYRALNELYNAYKAVTLPDGHHPNSWCDALYEEMSTWKRVEIYPEHLACLNSTLKERSEK